MSHYKHFDEPTHPLFFLRNKSMAPYTDFGDLEIAPNPGMTEVLA